MDSCEGIGTAIKPLFLFQNVETKNPLGQALTTLYEKLPEKLEDVPDPDTKREELKHLVLELRPYVSWTPSLNCFL